MPSGPKKRRASKRKKEVETILNSGDAPISQDVINNTSSANDANLGYCPVVATSNAVDWPVPEDKSVKGYIKAIPDEVEVVSPNQDELNMLPLVDTKATGLPSSIVSDLKDKKEIFALIHDNSLEDNYKEENLVVNDDDVEKYLKESEGDTLNISCQKSSEVVNLDDASAEILHGLGPKANYEVNFLQTNDDKENLVLESGGATLSPVAPDQARNTYGDNILQIDNTKSTCAIHQNPLVGISSHKEIAVEEENVWHDGKILNITEQVNCLKKTIEEALIATNKLREFLLKGLDDLDAIHLIEGP